MATKNGLLRNKMAEDFGTLFSGGTLKIRNSANVVLCSFPLQTPAFGSPSAGKITLAGVPIQVAAIASGTAHNAILESAGEIYVLSGLTVATSGANVIVDNVVIAEAQIINLTKFEWTEAETIA